MAAESEKEAWDLAAPEELAAAAALAAEALPLPFLPGAAAGAALLPELPAWAPAPWAPAPWAPTPCALLLLLLAAAALLLAVLLPCLRAAVTVSQQPLWQTL